MQIWPAGHTVPQAPQFLLSLLVSLQTPLQSVNAQVHALETHVSAPAHALEQLPQWAASLVRSVHVPLQLVLPVGQAQVELEQIMPPVQAVVQLPQWVLSVFGSTHAPEHVIVPLLQTQVPPVQSSPEVHALPHEPQLSWLVERSMQTPKHLVSPVVQSFSQLAPMHPSPVAHFTPQAPQFSTSVVRVTHLLPHFVVPLPQTTVQVPERHFSSPTHAFPHAPQLARSALVSAHTPLQLTRPASQLASAGASVVSVPLPVSASVVSSRVSPGAVSTPESCGGSESVEESVPESTVGIGVWESPEEHAADMSVSVISTAASQDQRPRMKSSGATGTSRRSTARPSDNSTVGDATTARKSPAERPTPVASCR
jgi:hypothetical protein